MTWTIGVGGIFDENSMSVCSQPADYHDGFHNWDENAPKIAAGPQMLEALEVASEFFACTPRRKPLYDVAKLVNAAIAAAKPERKCPTCGHTLEAKI